MFRSANRSVSVSGWGRVFMGRMGAWAFVLMSAAAARGADMMFVPVGASGPHTINGNEIILEGGGQIVFLEVQFANWAPTLLRAYESALDASGFSSGLKGALTPALFACTNDGTCVETFGGFCNLSADPCTTDDDCSLAQFGDACFGPTPACEFPPDDPQFCAPAFIHAWREDYVFRNVGRLEPIVDLSSENFRWAGAALSESIEDTGVPLYGGTLALDVPTTAMGTFVIEFFPEPLSSMLDPNALPIQPLNLIPARITVACQTDADCEDENACTDDSCSAEGVCSNLPNFDEDLFCCDPTSGTLTPISDDNDCTEDICDPVDGSVAHVALPAGTACGDPTDTECNGADTCDGVGNCQDNLAAAGAACGDATSSDCDDPDACDGAGVCEPNFVDAGTACGSPDDTDCTDPDACDGAGSCEPNDAPDGSPCSSGLFCTVGETCLDGACSGGTDRDCSDGLECTTDICNEEEDRCDNDIVEGACVIDGVCRDEGQFNPDNDCQECNPGIDPFTWSFRPEGSVCDDGNPCTGTGRKGIGLDTCDGAGTCAGALDPECNDDCEFAVAVAEGTHSGFSNEGMGPDDAEASCQPDSNNDVWFLYTASCTGTVFVSTTGSEFAPSNDPVLSVFSACPEDDGVEIACDDDSGVGLQAALFFEAVAEVQYWIRVAGFEDNVGAITLNIFTVDDCLIDGECRARGTVNPDNECEACIPEQSTVSWSPRLEGTACGNPAETECDNPDACDGNGVCEQNHKPDGTECSDDANECTLDFCLAGVCAHPPREAGTPCGNPAETECDKPDTCDGEGACLANFEPFGTSCGDSLDDQCDHPDRCDGVGFCDANLEPDGTPCDDGDICTGNDQCTAGACAGTLIAEAPDVVPFGPKRISVTPGPAGSPAPVALLLTSPDWPCLSEYVQPDGTLSNAPVFLLNDEWGTVFVDGIAIAPDSLYEVTAECGAFASPAGSARTSLWGDVVGEFTGTGWTPPNGIVDIANDVISIIDRFRGIPTAPPVQQVDLTPCDPDGIITILDVVAAIDAFRGLPFRCPLPCP